MSQPSIATLTMNPAIDLSYEVDAIEPTRKLRARKESLFPGGGGINVARVLARLGQSVQCVYPAGGATAPTFEALVRDHELHTVSVPIAGTTRIATTVFETETGQEYRFTPPGPELCEAEWRACLAKLEAIGADWLIASGSLPRGVPPDFYAQLAEQAARKGTRLVLDTSGEALRAGIASGGVCLAKPNLPEFEQLVGRPFEDPQEIGEAAHRLVRENDMQALVVTVGAQGAVLATVDTFEFCPALALEARSAVGAGDSFVAGMVHALSSGDDLQAAFRQGMAAGSAAILTAGSDLALRKDIEHLFAEYRKM